MAHTARETKCAQRATDIASPADELQPSADVWILRHEAARARRSADEYRRAHRDYTQLVRHRIANPLSAIRGNAQTLLDVRTLSDDLRDQLLMTIVEMTERIERLSLDPVTRSVEETCLDAMPRAEAV